MRQADLFRIRGVPDRMLEVLDQMHSDSPDRWIPRRAILANWWLFEEQEEILFGRGNLMLTGKNESGKTTILVALITLVLDRMYAPYRIDTTGDAQRAVRYYLVGKDEATAEHPFYHEERTGYVALEFERGNTGEFFTIGLALRTSRKWANHKVVAWSFVIRNGRRVGIDLDLIDAQSGRPLARHELRDMLGDGGQVFDESQQEEYQAAVNEGLFGFPSLEEFHRYLSVLHVVRRPKLGEGLTPEKVADLLVSSLPPVDMRPIDNASESFTRIDTIEAEIQRMEQQRNLAEKLEDAQVRAIEAQAIWDAVQYQSILKEKRDADRTLAAKEKALEDARVAERDSQAEVARLGIERATLKGMLEPLEEEFRNHHAFDVKKSLENAQKEYARGERELDALKRDLGDAETVRSGLEEQVGTTEGEWKGLTTDLRTHVTEFAALARNVFWPTLASRADLASLSLSRASVHTDESLASEIVISTVDAEAESRIRALEPVIAAHERIRAEETAFAEIVRHVKRGHAEYTAADERYSEVQAETDSVRKDAAEALGRWRSGLQVLSLPDTPFEAVCEAVREYADRSVPPGKILSPIRSAYAAARKEIEDERERLSSEQRWLSELDAEVRARIHTLEGQEAVEPERDPAQHCARARLTTAGVPHLPFYAAVDFRNDELGREEAARVEEALAHAGLLDALIVPRAYADTVSALLGESGLGDRWIRPAAQIAKDSPWFAPAATTVLETDDIRAALATIGCGLETMADNAIGADGSWRIGTLNGRAPGLAEEVRFIGETNRQMERERRIAEARDQLLLLEAQIECIDEERRVLVRRIEDLDREWEDVHNLRELHEMGPALAVLDEAYRTRDGKRKALETVMEAERAARGRADKYRLDLDRAVTNAAYAQHLGLEEIRHVRTGLEALRKHTVDLASEIRRAADIRKRHRAESRQVEAVEGRIRSLGPRIGEKHEQVTALKAHVDELNERLSRVSVGLDEIQERITEIKTRIGYIDGDLQTHNTTASAARGKIEVIEPEMDRLRDNVRSVGIGAQAAEHRLAGRLRSYPAFEGIVHDGVQNGWEGVAYTLAETVNRADAEDAAANALGELTATYHAHREAFAGLAPRLDPHVGLVLFSHPEGEMLTCTLLHRLENDLATKSAARDVQDREIIEKVFLRDITDAIRETIFSTQDWIDHVSDVLQEMDLFKGGVLRLKWEVRERGDGDSYDPKRLHELFTKRGIALHVDHQEELVDIFRSMVEEVRRRARDNNQSVDYHSALIGLLDYKKWYTLTIERRDETGTFRKLTRKRYGEGSIGRRTLDLLLPLIAAVYARLGAAGPAAPRLIGFDEAFAGVDDLNAAQIYGLLSSLGFCWIMATEKATNYGAHVAGAVTYEFINNGHDVAPSASVWDGQVQHAFEVDEIELESRYVLADLDDA